MAKTRNSDISTPKPTASSKRSKHHYASLVLCSSSFGGSANPNAGVHTTCRPGMNPLAFLPDLSVCPPPVWSPGRRGIRGKQKVIGNVADAKRRRAVKSHKVYSSRVSWTPDQLAEIARSTDWRQRQRVEKRLMHNADALARGKHLLASLVRICSCNVTKVFTRREPLVSCKKDSTPVMDNQNGNQTGDQKPIGNV